MKIIKHREYFENVFYKKIFGVKPNDMYFAFECSEEGIVDESTLHPDAVTNYHACKNGKKVVNGNIMEFLEIRKFNQEGYENAIGICNVCGNKLELSNPMTNTCDCGAEYNGSGQRLEDRRLWDDTDGATSADYE